MAHAVCTIRNVLPIATHAAVIIKEIVQFPPAFVWEQSKDRNTYVAWQEPRLE